MEGVMIWNHLSQARRTLTSCPAVLEVEENLASEGWWCRCDSWVQAQTQRSGLYIFRPDCGAKLLLLGLTIYGVSLTAVCSLFLKEITLPFAYIYALPVTFTCILTWLYMCSFKNSPWVLALRRKLSPIVTVEIALIWTCVFWVFWGSCLC